MPRTFFTSDTHFGHAGILSPRMRTQRPFFSIKEHDEHLIGAWNEVVEPTDDVWHLGDFAYRCSEAYARDVRARLRGRIRLIRGNHDAIAEGMDWSEPIYDVLQIYMRQAGGFTGIWLSHYAHVVWPGMWRGHIHLYGHSHGTLVDPPHGLSTDVGVDCWGWRPVTLEEIQVRLAATRAGGEP